MAVNGNNIARREVKTQIKIKESSIKYNKKLFIKDIYSFPKRCDTSTVIFSVDKPQPDPVANF